MGARARPRASTTRHDDDERVIDDRVVSASTHARAENDDDDDDPNASMPRPTGGAPPTKTTRKPPLDDDELRRAREDRKRRGVVFLASIPPFMKPMKLRQLLNAFGETDRMYLAPEDPATRAKRKKSGGNTGKKFVEGWVEFKEKKRAKRAAAMLHGREVGGKRRSKHYYDLWNVKYLPKFTWDTLTEEMEYQKALREKKLRLEMDVAKKERDFYLARMDQAKALEAMKERRAKRRAEEGAEDGETEEEALARYRREKKAEDEAERKKIVRTFKQKAVENPAMVDESKGLVSLDLLKSIFQPADE